MQCANSTKPLLNTQQASPTNLSERIPTTPVHNTITCIYYTVKNDHFQCDLIQRVFRKKKCFHAPRSPSKARTQCSAASSLSSALRKRQGQEIRNDPPPKKKSPPIIPNSRCYEIKLFLAQIAAINTMPTRKCPWWTLIHSEQNRALNSPRFNNTSKNG
ncbi:hypothetical protein B9Z19DRAFT_286738 [Tuber borchii]|uniref:Uncharacterized protein n=1 Tax=Tuber borchii TaxID=42251 RepID=A0A2T6ZKL7_TUBBO|nr:hypothetical protein B9Z19DRAFT_286738 [Tuber borchii]